MIFIHVQSVARTEQNKLIYVVESGLIYFFRERRVILQNTKVTHVRKTHSQSRGPGPQTPTFSFAPPLNSEAKLWLTDENTSSGSERAGLHRRAVLSEDDVRSHLPSWLKCTLVTAPSWPVQERKVNKEKMKREEKSERKREGKMIKNETERITGKLENK